MYNPCRSRSILIQYIAKYPILYSGQLEISLSVHSLVYILKHV